MTMQFMPTNFIRFESVLRSFLGELLHFHLSFYPAGLAIQAILACSGFWRQMPGRNLVQNLWSVSNSNQVTMDFHQAPLKRFGLTAPTEPSRQIHWEEQNLRQRLWDIIKCRRDGKKDVPIKTMHQWSNYYDEHYGPPVPLKTLYHYWEKLMPVILWIQWNNFLNNRRSWWSSKVASRL